MKKLLLPALIFIGLFASNHPVHACDINSDYPTPCYGNCCLEGLSCSFWKGCYKETGKTNKKTNKKLSIPEKK